MIKFCKNCKYFKITSCDSGICAINKKEVLIDWVCDKCEHVYSNTPWDEWVITEREIWGATDILNSVINKIKCILCGEGTSIECNQKILKYINEIEKWIQSVNKK